MRETCTVNYNGTVYEIRKSAGEVWSLIADRLNAAAARRDAPTRRPHFDASVIGGETKIFKGDAKAEGEYDPFLVLPLANPQSDAGVVALHVHDGMNLAIIAAHGELEPTDLFRGNV